MMMSFTDYVQTVEEYRKIRDMSELIEFNMYDDFDDFAYDVHVIYDGKYDKTLKRNASFYHLMIDGREPREDVWRSRAGADV